MYHPLNWKDIPGFPSHEINELGTVRTKSRTVILKNGQSRSYSRTYIQTNVNNCGYRQMKLCRDGKIYTCSLHRLLALVFIPNPASKAEVNHIDGDKLNNNLANLEWVSHAENMSHAYKLGLITYTSKPVFDRCQKKVFPSMIKAAEYYGINRNNLKEMLTGNKPPHPCLGYHRSKEKAKSRPRK
jgi:hypothetical protein